MTLFDIVNTRYESMLSTIYTSQYSLESLQERLSRAHETETAKAIVSRIRETCRRFEGTLKTLYIDEDIMALREALEADDGKRR